MKFNIFEESSFAFLFYFFCMKYRVYFFELIFVFTALTACLYYFGNQDLNSSLFISGGTSLLTVVNRYYLDKKALKKEKSSKS